MVLLAAIVTVAAVWFTGKIENHENAFYACLLFISGGAIGAFASMDLFFFYAFHELALIPTFLLIGIWGSGNRTAAAWKITIYLATGSFILLLGLILLYQSMPAGHRTFDMIELKKYAALIPPEAQRNIYLLLLIGFGVLVSLFPFHSWAPEAYASAPAPAAMLHAGVLKKFGLYGRWSQRARNIGPVCWLFCCSVTSFTSGWLRSRRSDSIGCWAIPASCTWATFFWDSPAPIFSARPGPRS
jgi:NADH-quinone oxidoreductase subunit M